MAELNLNPDPELNGLVEDLLQVAREDNHTPNEATRVSRRLMDAQYLEMGRIYRFSYWHYLSAQTICWTSLNYYLLIPENHALRQFKRAEDLGPHLPFHVEYLGDRQKFWPPEVPHGWWAGSTLTENTTLPIGEADGTPVPPSPETVKEMLRISAEAASVIRATMPRVEDGRLTWRPYVDRTP